MRILADDGRDEAIGGNQQHVESLGQLGPGGSGFLNTNPKMRYQEMKVRSAILLGMLFMLASAAFAQDPKVEIPLVYSFMRFNPENSDIVSGFSMNGGGGGVIVNVNHFFGI
jgi:hypothetical protein